MRKEQLIATALVVALGATPGIAPAQNTDTGTHNASGANFGSNGTGSSATANTATANNNAGNANNPAAYQQIGRGNYDGMATPIPAQRARQTPIITRRTSFPIREITFLRTMVVREPAKLSAPMFITLRTRSLEAWIMC